jgi:glycosyltransferase involved in cell wall biosynthesis
MNTGVGILCITPWLRGGGIDRVIENTVPWLSRRGYRCEVASWDVATHLSGQPNPVLHALAAAGVPVRRLPAYGRFRLVQRALRAAVVALRAKHRLLIGYELEGNLVALMAKRFLHGRVRVMAQTHNASRIHAEVGTSAALLALARRLYRDADLMVTVSESSRLDTIRFFMLDRTPVVTVHNPLPLARIREMASHASPIRHSPRAIVGCGRLVRMKGFHDLVTAFSAIRKDHPVRLVILGEGPERANLAGCARTHGVSEDVSMPGHTPNPWAYFRDAAAFVLSSLFGEAFPMVLVEAMACGAPVIASRCEWGPDEILDDGRYGLLYEPGDVQTLTEHLRTVLGDSSVAWQLAASALRRVETFAEERVLPELEAYVAQLSR